MMLRYPAPLLPLVLAACTMLCACPASGDTRGDSVSDAAQDGGGDEQADDTAVDDTPADDTAVDDTAAGTSAAGTSADTHTSVSAVPGTVLRMDFGAATDDIYAAPWPAEHLRLDGGISLTGFPRPHDDGLVDRMAAVIEADADGFATTAPVHFAASAPLDPAALPTLMSTTAPDATVFVVSVDPDADDHGTRYPIDVHYQADGGPLGAPHLLTIVPLQGVPLQPGTRYAAVVRRVLGDASGSPLGVPLALARALDGQRPDGLLDAAWAEIDAGLAELDALGVDRAEIAGLAVFRTGHPQAAMSRWLDHALSAALPSPPALEPHEIFDDYCVFEGTMDLPIYQVGAPPFLDTGGGWTLDAAGDPAVQGVETARVVVTVPRSPPPPGGHPTLVFIRTGGGGDRPLVDRGVRGEPGGDPLVPGSGPALELARAGWAGVSVDGPHGGLRNVMGGDEQLLIFNIDNPEALRDNIRQSALEIALLAEVLGDWTIDAAACPGADGTATLDPDRLALMGHSMGATIAPLALAVQPAYRAVVLSGAGGSWIENVLYKQSPLEVRPVAELILGYHLIGRTLAAGDPALTLLQWAGEPADPPIFGRAITAERANTSQGTHILMLQGIVDTYILPPIANATSLSLGLDLAGPSLDAAHPTVGTTHRPLEALLHLVGATTATLPVAGNADGVTAVVVQHPEDGIEDGHEVVFQTAAPKHAYRCFLEDLAAGEVPTVRSGDGIGCD